MLTAPRDARPNYSFYPTLIITLRGAPRRQAFVGNDQPQLILNLGQAPSITPFGSIYHSGGTSLSRNGYTLVNVRLDNDIVAGLAKAASARLQVGALNIELTRALRDEFADAYRLSLCGYATE